MEYWLKFAHWVYDMQSLIVGFIATVAAFWTIKTMQKQIMQQSNFRKEDEAEELKAKLNSFAFKVMRYVDEISRMSMHIQELRDKHPSQADEDFYLIFQPVIAEGIILPDITENDSYILSKIKKLDVPLAL